MDNGLELVSQALQRFCGNRVGLLYIPPGTPWNNGYIESFNNRLRKECLTRNHWNTVFEARVVIGDFKTEHNHRHRHSALGYRTPAEYATSCRCTSSSNCSTHTSSLIGAETSRLVGLRKRGRVNFRTCTC
jgi:putative transposase